jgi:hypothetical protein
VNTRTDKAAMPDSAPPTRDIGITPALSVIHALAQPIQPNELSTS